MNDLELEWEMNARDLVRSLRFSNPEVLALTMSPVPEPPSWQPAFGWRRTVRRRSRKRKENTMYTVIGSKAQEDSDLAGRLAKENIDEDAGRLASDDRLTCQVHGRWIYECVSSPEHVNKVTRHRWCRDCAAVLTVVVDDVAGTVTMSCPGCGYGHSAATRRLLAACRGSIATRASLATAAHRPLPVDLAA